jgi:hypothetical protein
MKDNRPNPVISRISQINNSGISHCEAIWRVESREMNRYHIDPDEYLAKSENFCKCDLILLDDCHRFYPPFWILGRDIESIETPDRYQGVDILQPGENQEEPILDYGTM